MLTPLESFLLEIVGQAKKPIALSDIVSLLNEIRGATILSLVTKTEARLRAEGKKRFGPVQKVSRFTAMINFDYEAAVNRQREKEGVAPSFEAMPSYAQVIMRADGTMTPFAAHKETGKQYLRIRPLSRSDSKYFDTNGYNIEETAIKEYLYESGNPIRQELNKPIPYRLISLENVVAIGYQGKFNLLTQM